MQHSNNSQVRQIRTLANNLQAHMSRYGYQVIDNPIIESADLFLTKAGDQVAEQLFTFERHGKMLALRPEFTAAAAHRYITQQQPGDLVRWQFNGPVFTDDPVIANRDYQQQSSGAELLGAAGAGAEAEIISMAAQGLLAQNLDDWTLIIGHVGLTRHLLARYHLDPHTQRFILQRRGLLHDHPDGHDRLLKEVMHHFPAAETQDTDAMSSDNTQQMLDALLDSSRSAATMGGRTREDIARRLLRKRQQAAQHTQIEAAIAFLQAWMTIDNLPKHALNEIDTFLEDDADATAMLADWRNTMTLLETYGIPQAQISIVPDLARTWDYYTGVVFEIRNRDGQLLAGGGRYDELTRLVGGDQAVPAVGFAYHLERIQTHSTTDNTADYVALVNGDQTDMHTANWAHRLRQHGVAVAVFDRPPTQARYVLNATEEGHVYLNDHVYMQDHIEQLVAKLNGR